MTTEFKVAVGALGFLALVLCFAIAGQHWGLAIAAVGAKAVVVAGHSIAGAIARRFSQINPVALLCHVIEHLCAALPQGQTMSSVPSSLVSGIAPAPASVVANAINAVAAKVDATNTAQLAALLTSALQYGVLKLEQIVNKTSLASKYPTELQTLFALLNSQV